MKTPGATPGATPARSRRVVPASSPHRPRVVASPRTVRCDHVYACSSSSRGRTWRSAHAFVEASDLEKHIVTSTTKASEMSAGCTWPGRAKDNNDLNSCKTATAARRDSHLPTFLLRRPPFFHSGLCACRNVRTKTTCSLHLAGPSRFRPGRRRRSTNAAKPPGCWWCSGGLPAPAAGAGAPRGLEPTASSPSCRRRVAVVWPSCRCLYRLFQIGFEPKSQKPNMETRKTQSRRCMPLTFFSSVGESLITSCHVPVHTTRCTYIAHASHHTLANLKPPY